MKVGTEAHSSEAGLVSRKAYSTVEWDSGYHSPSQSSNSPLGGLSLMFSGEGMLRIKLGRKASPVVMLQQWRTDGLQYLMDRSTREKVHMETLENWALAHCSSTWL